jgi:hypothetical protein
MGPYRKSAFLVALPSLSMKPCHLPLRGALALFALLADSSAARSATEATGSPAGGLAAAGAPDAPTVAAPVSSAPIFDEDGPTRFSLPTESDRALWKKPGFRFGLGLVYGRMYGINGPPSASLIGPAIRMGVRLDDDWSVLGSLQYLYATGAMQGLRFAGTIEPTWHATDHLSLAAGIGFGGIVERTSLRTNPDPQPSTLDTSYTFPNARNPIPGCNGVGVTGLLRAEWMMVIGPRASTGLALEMNGQWTGCVDNTGTFEPDTARAVVRRQWWSHMGGTLAWGILWR